VFSFISALSVFSKECFLHRTEKINEIVFNTVILRLFEFFRELEIILFSDRNDDIDYLMFQIKELLYPNLRLFENRYESLTSKRNSVKKGIGELIEQYNLNEKKTKTATVQIHKPEQANTPSL